MKKAKIIKNGNVNLENIKTPGKPPILAEYKSLQEQYRQLICNELYGTHPNYEEMLMEDEIRIIDKCYFLYKEKIDEIVLLNKEISRLTIENLNLKAEKDNKDY